MNREWHRKNKMPKKATFEQRRQWHLKHAKHCGCRPIPADIIAPGRSAGKRSSPGTCL